MGRKERRDNSKLRELMDEYGVKTMEDVQNFVKMLTAETIQAALDAELESDLGYSKYDYKTSRQITAGTATHKRQCRAVSGKWKSTFQGP